MIEGSAAGITIVRSSLRRPYSKTLATSRYEPETPLIPSRVLRAIGIDAPIAMKTILNNSSMPRQSRRNGIQAIIGTCLIELKSGPRYCSTTFHVPMTVPRRKPPDAPKRKPKATRCRLIFMLIASSPLLCMSHQVSNNILGAGSNWGENSSRRVTISQAARIRSGTISPINLFLSCAVS